MKFLMLYVMTLITCYVFGFFGGFQLFNFRENFFLALAACALIIAVLLYCLISQSEKINQLEKRIKELETKGLENRE